MLPNETLIYLYLPIYYVHAYNLFAREYSFKDLTFIATLFNYKYSIFFSWAQLDARKFFFLL